MRKNVWRDAIFWNLGHPMMIPNIDFGQGEFLYDSKGKGYVDLESGIWCTSLGHQHQRIIEAIQDQSEQMMHTGYIYAHPIIEKSAKTLLRTMGFQNGKGEFLCSGSEAIEFGVRFVQSFLEKPLFLTLADSYFGAYGSASKKDSEEWVTFDWLQHCKNCNRKSLCQPSCKALNNIPMDRLNAFLFEPGSSSGMVRFPPKALIQTLCSLVQDNGGIVMVNEITTGIGRTGRWYGFQHYGIEPDIVAIGKGIGNGYPVSFTGFSEKCCDRSIERPFRYAQSHQNDPLGARVALEVALIIKEEKLVTRSRDEGKFLLAKLQELQNRFSKIQAVRGRGLMIAFEIDQAEILFRRLLDRGFILSLRTDGKTLRLDPCLTVAHETLEQFLVTLEEELVSLDSIPITNHQVIVPPSIHFETVSSDELDPFIELMNQEAHEYLEPTLTLMNLSWDQFSDLVRNTGNICSLHLGEDLVGYLWFEVRDEVLHIHGIVLFPEYQGKGFGTEAFGKIPTYFSEGVGTIELGVHQSNERALQLYHKWGFRKIRFLEDVGFFILQSPINQSKT